VDAAKGDNAARKLVLQLNEQREIASAQLEQAAQSEDTPLELADKQILEEYRREILAEAAAAAAASTGTGKKEK
jgi:hypothetical protein